MAGGVFVASYRAGVCWTSGLVQIVIALSGSRKSMMLMTNWLKAAVNRDGKAYCAQLTFDLQERLTGEQSDQATKQCEKSATSPLAGDLPLRIGIVPENATAQEASTKLIAEIPEELALVTEDSKLKIDDVKGGEGKGEDTGGREGGSMQDHGSSLG